MRIDRSNYKEMDSEDLAHGLHTGEYELVETGVEALVEIIKHLTSDIANRPRLRKRVEHLEAAQIANTMALEKVCAHLKIDM